MLAKSKRNKNKKNKPKGFKGTIYIIEPSGCFSARKAHPEARRAEGSPEILRRCAPQDEQSQRRKNSPTVHIIKDRCKGCGFCIECCPKQILKTSEDYNEKGYRYPVLINEKRCENCKICEDICPEFAIFSTTKKNTKA